MGVSAKHMRSHIAELLRRSGAAAMADRRLRHEFGVELESEIVTNIVEELIAEMPDVAARIKPELSTERTTPVEIRTSFTRRRHAMYVVVPICNASDDEVERCIRSIVRNLDGLDFCLLLFANRPLTPGIADAVADTSSVQFRFPSFSLP